MLFLLELSKRDLVTTDRRGSRCWSRQLQLGGDQRLRGNRHISAGCDHAIHFFAVSDFQACDWVGRADVIGCVGELMPGIAWPIVDRDQAKSHASGRLIASS